MSKIRLDTGALLILEDYPDDDIESESDIYVVLVNHSYSHTSDWELTKKYHTSLDRALNEIKASEESIIRSFDESNREFKEREAEFLRWAQTGAEGPEPYVDWDQGNPSFAKWRSQNGFDDMAYMVRRLTRKD